MGVYLLLLLLEPLLCVLQVAALGAVVDVGEEHGGLALARLHHVTQTRRGGVGSQRRHIMALICSIKWLTALSLSQHGYAPTLCRLALWWVGPSVTFFLGSNVSAPPPPAPRPIQEEGGWEDGVEGEGKAAVEGMGCSALREAMNPAPCLDVRHSGTSLYSRSCCRTCGAGAGRGGRVRLCGPMSLIVQAFAQRSCVELALCLCTLSGSKAGPALRGRGRTSRQHTSWNASLALHAALAVGPEVGVEVEAPWSMMRSSHATRPSSTVPEQLAEKQDTQRR